MLRDTSDVPDADLSVLAFTDETDRAWEVHEIREPVLPERGKLLLRGEYSEGWLLFISGEERRRLAPYPRGWRLADPARLRCWVNDARPVRSTDRVRADDRVYDLPALKQSSRDPT